MREDDDVMEAVGEVSRKSHGGIACDCFLLKRESMLSLSSLRCDQVPFRQSAGDWTLEWWLLTRYERLQWSEGAPLSSGWPHIVYHTCPLCITSIYGML
ncbi:hypothetical protein AAC387_Pa09g1769 [Persea americana]